MSSELAEFGQVSKWYSNEVLITNILVPGTALYEEVTEDKQKNMIGRFVKVFKKRYSVSKTEILHTDSFHEVLSTSLFNDENLSLLCFFIQLTKSYCSSLVLSCFNIYYDRSIVQEFFCYQVFSSEIVFNYRNKRFAVCPWETNKIVLKFISI